MKQLSEDTKKTLRVFKALVPENAFGKGKDPTAEVREAWGQQGDAEPKELTGEGELEIFNRFVMLVLRGPTKNIQTMEDPDTIDWQSGKLKCTVITGESNFESDKLGLKADLTHRLLINDKIPFRLAGSKFHIDVKVLGQDVEAGAEFSIVERASMPKACCRTSSESLRPQLRLAPSGDFVVPDRRSWQIDTATYRISKVAANKSMRRPNHLFCGQQQFCNALLMRGDSNHGGGTRVSRKFC